MSSSIPPVRWRWPELLVILALIGAVWVAYRPVNHAEFLTYDDDAYVTQNPELRRGLTWSGLNWGLTTFHFSNWHPLVWWSFLLDRQLYGMNPSGFHLTNLLWHTGSAVLLFATLRAMTGDLWPSALAAALFAIHPLNVQSVAWVSERKGVVSTFFWLLTMYAYAAYARRPGYARYLLVTVSFALGLMAKQMLVTLPAILLLLDFWPLHRVRLHGDTGMLRGGLRLLLEKAPLGLLALAAGVLTVMAQAHAGSVTPTSIVSISARLKNVPVAYVTYLGQALAPFKLAPFYPHPGDAVPLWQSLLAAAGLALVTLLALAQVRRRPYLALGWLWYVLTLLPVIGLIQLGQHAHADRYAYVPLIGIFIALAWGSADLARAGRAMRAIVPLWGALLVFLGAVTWMQTHYWNNSVVLWENALRVTGSSDVAHLNLGAALTPVNKEEARRHFEIALQLDPASVNAHHNLGLVLMDMGEWTQAREHFLRVIQLDPQNTRKQFTPIAHANLGIMLMEEDKPQQALRHLDEAVRMDPGLEERLRPYTQRRR